MRHRRLPGAVDHRVPAGGPRDEAWLRRRQRGRAGQARRPDPELHGRGRVRRRGPRPVQRRRGLRPGRGPRHVPQAAAPELRRVRRGPLLHAGQRDRPSRAVRHRRRQGRDQHLRGHLEPGRATGRAGRRWRRAGDQHQRLAVPPRQGRLPRADAGDAGRRLALGAGVREPGGWAGRAGLRRLLPGVRRRGRPARPRPAVPRGAADRRRPRPCRVPPAPARSARPHLAGLVADRRRHRGAGHPRDAGGQPDRRAAVPRRRALQGARARHPRLLRQERVHRRRHRPVGRHRLVARRRDRRRRPRRRPRPRRLDAVAVLQRPLQVRCRPAR